jgi:hypothetical protein
MLHNVLRKSAQLWRYATKMAVNTARLCWKANSSFNSLLLFRVGTVQSWDGNQTLPSTVLLDTKLRSMRKWAKLIPAACSQASPQPRAPTCAPTRRVPPLCRPPSPAGRWLSRRPSPPPVPPWPASPRLSHSLPRRTITGTATPAMRPRRASTAQRQCRPGHTSR